MKKLLVTGCNGQLGREINKKYAGRDDIELINTDVDELDITNIDEVTKLMEEVKPYAIINCAAHTAVDKCEVDGDNAYKINAIGPRNLSIAATKVGAKMVHISTDYVFAGDGTEPYTEFDQVNPKSMYGRTKLAGEEFVKQFADKYFIIRTAWLYGINGKNFPKTMLELAENHDEVKVVYDEVGTPTYTPDLAKAISQLINTDYFGIYHITNSGSCSWCEFSKYIFEIAKKNVKVIPVTASEFARAAPRPHYSVLENKKWVEKGFKPLRSYKDAIKEYLELLNE